MHEMAAEKGLCKYLDKREQLSRVLHIRQREDRKMKALMPKDYANLLTNIKERIRSAQYDALKSVNKELVSLYSDIGKMIIERQKGESWGKSIVKQLAADLQKEFPDAGGFSVQNLWYMRQFYLEYESKSKLQPLVGEISWSHNLVIMSQCKDDIEREFYIRMTKRQALG